MGLISKLQPYATKDGPGIRTTVFCVGCNLRCKWCANPESMLPDKKVLYFKRKCQKCGCCAAASNGTIILEEDGCHIDRDRCGDLSAMVALCPFDAYEYSGTELTAAQLHQRLMKDAVFYRNSGGGVTFSGGECCLQPDFVLETVRLLKRDGIHVALDTAGLWDFARLRPLLELADLILYDIKAMDPVIHRRWTGVDNALILENARHLAAMGKPMHVRLILVPDINDGPDELAARFAFVNSLGPCVERIDVLPYHKLGEGKYEAMQLPYPMQAKPYRDGAVEALIAPWISGPTPVTIGG